jgi:hypothetical protein
MSDKSSLAISHGLALNDGFKPAHFIWLILVAEMILKFFPNKLMSFGCRKQFKTVYLPVARELPGMEIAAWVKEEDAAAKKVFWLWLGGNAVIGILYLMKVLSESDMVLLSLFYFVCDLVCVLLYCPFQSLLMKNQCCITCRIFNWDSLMTVTPLLFIPCLFSWSLILIATCSLVRWEITYRRHPQRFMEAGNANLQCKHCNEKLCRLKRPVGVGGFGELNCRNWPAGHGSKHIRDNFHTDGFK